MAVAVEVNTQDSRVVLADLNGDIVRKRTVSWHPNTDLFFEHIHSAIQSLIQPLRAEQVLGVGVGLPGTIDRNSGKVIAAENFNWFGIEAGNLLRGRLPFPFYYENSAKLAALSEMWSSEREGKPLRNFVFVTVRGGLGTGVIADGQLFQGAYSAAAEFGHTMLYPDGRRCPCGNTGCWEQYASDLALCRLYGELSAKSGVAVEPAAIVRMAREEDPAARRALLETARYAALGFLNLVWALNPEAIVVGDWLADAWDMIEETIWNVMRSRVAGYNLNGLRIVPSRHAADSSLFGAIALVLGQFFTSFESGKASKANRTSHPVVMHSSSQRVVMETRE